MCDAVWSDELVRLDFGNSGMSGCGLGWLASVSSVRDQRWLFARVGDVT